MMNPRLHTTLSVLAGLFAATAPLRAANVLYFRDTPIGPDRVAEALGALGHSVTLAVDANDFETQIASHAYELGVIFVQTRPAAEYASAIQALSAFVSDGGRALYADWSRNAALAAGFDAGFTGSHGGRSATVIELEPGNVLVPDAIKLRNTGWFQATSGLIVRGHSTVAATFDGGAAAIVRGESGRSLVFGFLGDTPETAAIFARGAEAVLAPADLPIITQADNPATLFARSASLIGSVVPTNATTTFVIDYGLTVNYGAQTDPQTIPGGYSPVPLNTTLEGLAPHTTYHYRFRASNLAGTTSTPDLTFTTLNTPPIANKDRVVAPAANVFTFQPLLNDTDADGDALTIVDVTAGEFGNVTFDTGALTYTAAPAGLRSDVFTYTISDGFGGWAIATVFIDVPLPHFRGEYTQLLVGPGGRIVGCLTLTLGAGGAFTGRLVLEGRSDSIAGAFASNGSAHFVKTRPGANGVIFDLDLLLTGAGPRILGEISDGIDTWSVAADGVRYNGDRVPPFAKGGRYTLAVLESRDPQVPRGDAWAVFAGEPEGRLRLTGRFADGERFFADAQVQPDGTLPLYALRQDAPVEALAGVLQFTGDRGGQLRGELTWTRFPGKNDAGFSVTSSVRGGRYRPPPAGKPLLRFPENTSRQASATLLSQLQGFPWKQTFRVGASGFFPSDPQDDRISLQFARSTGKLTGSFDHPTLGPGRIGGVLLQQENMVRGNFSGTGFSGGFRLIPR